MSNTENNYDSDQDNASIEAKIELILLKEFAKTSDPRFKDKTTSTNINLAKGSALTDNPVYVTYIAKSDGIEDSRTTLRNLFGHNARYHPDFKTFMDSYEQKTRAQISDYDEQGEKMRGITIKTNDPAINI